MTLFTDKAIAENAEFYGQTKSDLEIGMRNEFYKQIDENTEFTTAQKQEYKEWYDDYLSAGGLDAVSDFAGVASSLGLELAKAVDSGIPIPPKVTFYFRTKAVPLDFVANLIDGNSVMKAATKAITSFAVFEAATFLVTAAVTGAAGVAALPAGAAIVVGAIGIGVGYLLSNKVVSEVSEGWDYLLGPDYESRYIGDVNSLTLTINGKFSDALRNYWDGVELKDEEGDPVKQFDDVDVWTLEHRFDSPDQLRISFENTTQKLFLENAPGANLRAVYNSNKENALTLNLLLERVDDGIDATIGGTTRTIDNIIRKVTEDGGLAAFKQRVLDGNASASEIAALENLLTFFENGVDSSGNIDPVEYTEIHSQQFIEDRIDFLYHFSREAAGKNPDPYSANYVDTTYHDPRYHHHLGTGLNMVSAGVDPTRMYAWGTAFGTAGDDRFYGTSGDDHFQGSGGNDYFEGGKGKDLMEGMSDNDTFFIMGEDEEYDIFNGGGGDDTIKGSNRADTIRVNHFEGQNTVENIDGGGVSEGSGMDILAGTEQSDTIDLTETHLKKIQEIQLGDGSDTLRFHERKYDGTLKKIDGGDGEDSIKGLSDDSIFVIGDPEMNIDLQDVKISSIEKYETGDDDDTLNLENAIIEGNITSIDTKEKTMLSNCLMCPRITVSSVKSKLVTETIPSNLRSFRHVRSIRSKVVPMTTP